MLSAKNSWRFKLTWSWLKAETYLCGDSVRLVRWHPTEWGKVVWYVWDVPLDEWLSVTLAEMEERVLSFIRKKDDMMTGATDLPIAQDEHMGELFPAILEYMTRTQDDEGQPRKTATVTVCVQDGYWKATLNDRQTGLQCWVTAGSALESIKALEAALIDPKTIWKQNPFAGQAAPRKKGR